jgi:hypothetical protein
MVASFCELARTSNISIHHYFSDNSITTSIHVLLSEHCDLIFDFKSSFHPLRHRTAAPAVTRPRSWQLAKVRKLAMQKLLAEHRRMGG